MINDEIRNKKMPATMNGNDTIVKNVFILHL
jgi:hypothetical protein